MTSRKTSGVGIELLIVLGKVLAAVGGSDAPMENVPRPKFFFESSLIETGWVGFSSLLAIERASSAADMLESELLIKLFWPALSGELAKLLLTGPALLLDGCLTPACVG